jgi:hypothetical protein
MITRKTTPPTEHPIAIGLLLDLRTLSVLNGLKNLYGFCRTELTYEDGKEVGVFCIVLEFSTVVEDGCETGSLDVNTGCLQVKQPELLTMTFNGTHQYNMISAELR